MMIQIVRNIRGRRSRAVRLDMVLAGNSSTSGVVRAEDSRAGGSLEADSSSNKEDLGFDLYMYLTYWLIEPAWTGRFGLVAP